ncbi:hypothetical protein HDU96_005590 [Phlyctochytrium bullatum]|nr:hypothetical protein HDU96_005590 [Phlyctochytrium bullatum]
MKDNTTSSLLPSQAPRTPDRLTLELYAAGDPSLHLPATGRDDPDDLRHIAHVLEAVAGGSYRCTVVVKLSPGDPVLVPGLELALSVYERHRKHAKATKEECRVHVDQMDKECGECAAVATAATGGEKGMMAAKKKRKMKERLIELHRIVQAVWTEPRALEPGSYETTLSFLIPATIPATHAFSSGTGKELIHVLSIAIPSTSPTSPPLLVSERQITVHSCAPRQPPPLHSGKRTQDHHYVRTVSLSDLFMAVKFPQRVMLQDRKFRTSISLRPALGKESIVTVGSFDVHLVERVKRPSSSTHKDRTKILSSASLTATTTPVTGESLVDIFLPLPAHARPHHHQHPNPAIAHALRVIARYTALDPFPRSLESHAEFPLIVACAPSSQWRPTTPIPGWWEPLSPTNKVLQHWLSVHAAPAFEFGRAATAAAEDDAAEEPNAGIDTRSTVSSSDMSFRTAVSVSTPADAASFRARASASLPPSSHAARRLSKSFRHSLPAVKLDAAPSPSSSVQKRRSLGSLAGPTPSPFPPGPLGAPMGSRSRSLSSSSATGPGGPPSVLKKRSLGSLGTPHPVGKSSPLARFSTTAGDPDPPLPAPVPMTLRTLSEGSGVDLAVAAATARQVLQGDLAAQNGLLKALAGGGEEAVNLSLDRQPQPAHRRRASSTGSTQSSASAVAGSQVSGSSSAAIGAGGSQVSGTSSAVAVVNGEPPGRRGSLRMSLPVTVAPTDLIRSAASRPAHGYDVAPGPWSLPSPPMSTPPFPQPMFPAPSSSYFFDPFAPTFPMPPTSTALPFPSPPLAWDPPAWDAAAAAAAAAVAWDQYCQHQAYLSYAAAAAVPRQGDVFPVPPPDPSLGGDYYASWYYAAAAAAAQMAAASVAPPLPPPMTPPAVVVTAPPPPASASEDPAVVVTPTPVLKEAVDGSKEPVPAADAAPPHEDEDDGATLTASLSRPESADPLDGPARVDGRHKQPSLAKPEASGGASTPVLRIDTGHASSKPAAPILGDRWITSAFSPTPPESPSREREREGSWRTVEEWVSRRSGSALAGGADDEEGAGWWNPLGAMAVPRSPESPPPRRRSLAPEPEDEDDEEEEEGEAGLEPPSVGAFHRRRLSSADFGFAGVHVEMPGAGMRGSPVTGLASPPPVPGVSPTPSAVVVMMRASPRVVRAPASPVSPVAGARRWSVASAGGSSAPPRVPTPILKPPRSPANGVMGERRASVAAVEGWGPASVVVGLEEKRARRRSGEPVRVVVTKSSFELLKEKAGER